MGRQNCMSKIFAFIVIFGSIHFSAIYADTDTYQNFDWNGASQRLMQMAPAWEPRLFFRDSDEDPQLLVVLNVPRIPFELLPADEKKRMEEFVGLFQYRALPVPEKILAKPGTVNVQYIEAAKFMGPWAWTLMGEGIANDFSQNPRVIDAMKSDGNYYATVLKSMDPYEAASSDERILMKVVDSRAKMEWLIIFSGGAIEFCSQYLGAGSVLGHLSSYLTDSGIFNTAIASAAGSKISGVAEWELGKKVLEVDGNQSLWAKRVFFYRNIGVGMKSNKMADMIETTLATPQKDGRHIPALLVLAPNAGIRHDSGFAQGIYRSLMARGNYSTVTQSLMVRTLMRIGGGRTR
jgi:hypothetical protein